MKHNAIYLVAAAAVGSAATLGFQMITASRISSEESHAVWNYINEQGVAPEMEARFNAVNSDWPPTKADMGTVLLEARMASLSKPPLTAK